MSITDEIMNTFLQVVDGLTPDLDNLYEGTRTSNLDDWKITQRAAVAASGAASAAIPGLHLVGLAADAAFVINRMSVASLGVGAILSERAAAGNILETDDFPAVLGYWCHDDGIQEAMKGKGAVGASTVGAKIGAKVAGKAFAKGMTKTMLMSSGYLIGQRLGGKAMAKASAKFAGKFAGKAVGGMVPFVGPVVGAGINLWMISGIIEASELYYADKIALFHGN
jgi:hypothetical protein